jgi:hypothetical protein
MTWLDLETDWLRAGNNSYFSPTDEEGISLFDAHLRMRRIPFVKRLELDIPAVVFSPFPAADDMALAA